MRIKLKKLYSEPEIFKPIPFDSGINLIMGEKSSSPDTKKGRKTNGVGKSLCAEFINFCLLKNGSDSRVAKIPESKISKETKIILDLNINSHELTIIRSLKEMDSPVIIKNNHKEVFNNLNDANLYLQKLLFENCSNNNIFPSFREFLGPFMRDEDSEFKDIIECYDLKKKIPKSNLIKTHSFVFGISLSNINKIQGIFKGIDKANKHKSSLNDALTNYGTRKISDIKSVLNSLHDDLAKINDAINDAEISKAKEICQKDLIDYESEMEDLRSKQSAIKYQIKKMRSFPSMEKINEEEVEIVYNQFKSGLGGMISKSLKEVSDFKRKIDEFQHKIFNEKIVALEKEFDDTSNRVKILERESNKLKNIDSGQGIYKEIRDAVAIHEDRKNSYSNLKASYETYEQNISRLKELKRDKDDLFLKIDKQIYDIKATLESFNNSILKIHQYIMDSNVASFDIKTVNKGSNKQIILYEMRIDDDGSHSVDRAKVFIYDLALMFNKNTSKNHPQLLIHDNIFDVDQDTLVKSLNYLSSQESSDFQYILTLNRDKIENEEVKKIISLDIDSHKIANFTKTNRFLYGEKYLEK